MPGPTHALTTSPGPGRRPSRGWRTRATSWRASRPSCASGRPSSRGPRPDAEALRAVHILPSALLSASHILAGILIPARGGSKNADNIAELYTLILVMATV